MKSPRHTNKGRGDFLVDFPVNRQLVAIYNLYLRL